MAQARHADDERAELRAALTSCALFDRNDSARVIGDGPDLLGLLQRLSTADLGALEPGAGKPTVLTSPKGRIVQRLHVHHLRDTGLLLIAGQLPVSGLLDHIARFTFAEETGLADASASWALFGIAGPRADEATRVAGFEAAPRYGAIGTEHEGRQVFVIGHDGDGGPGQSFLVPQETSATVQSVLSRAVRQCDGLPASRRAREDQRILRGLPASGAELTQGYNPLEAGLLEAVSFNKGCYVGQEVVARLQTYDKVSRRLVGLEFLAEAAPPDPPIALFHAGKTVGTLTSVTRPAGFDRAIGLAYVKRSAIERGALVSLGDAQATSDIRVVDLPFDFES